jgi:hypothetical protein
MILYYHSATAIPPITLGAFMTTFTPTFASGQEVFGVVVGHWVVIKSEPSVIDAKEIVTVRGIKKDGTLESWEERYPVDIFKK